MKNRLLHHVKPIAALVFILSCHGSSQKSARISVFNDCKPQISRKVNDDDCIKDWFYFTVTHGGKGFFPVFIPFCYKCEGTKPDTNQSLTFPSLLSFKFDFVPDNHCSRHPAFIYARDYPARNVKMTDPESEIAAYIKAWSATHAIGGELVESNSGFSGTIVVFDTNGKEILRKVYKESVPYFSLMGKMVEDWMNYAGWKISEGLLRELMRPMTKDMETVRMYGQVFSMDHRSQEEWSIYEDILEKDPDFAEVRFWYANQKGWNTGDNEATETAYVQTLANHLVMPALSYFDIMYCPADSLVRIFKEKLDYAQQLFPEGNPHILQEMISVYEADLTSHELDSMYAFAQDFPSYYPLLTELAHQYRRRNELDKAIPLCFSAVNSGYVTGTGTFDWPLSEIGYNFTQLGYLDEGDMFSREAFIQSGSENSWIYYHIACNLRDRFCFKEASEYFRKGFLELKNEWMLCAAYMSLYEAGDTSTAKNWLSESYMQPKDDDVKLIIESRQAIADGDLERAQQLMDRMPFNRVNREVDNRIQIEAEIVKADIALLSGDKNKAYRAALNSYLIDPRSRRTLYLVELSFHEQQQLGRLFSIAAFIFPKQPYWQAKLKKVRRSGFKDDSDAEIMEMYKGLTKAYDDYPYSKSSFWLNADPFFMEYMCLRMVKTADAERRDKGLTLYLTYYNDMKDLFSLHTAHNRAFFLSLLNLIPLEQRACWQKKI